MWTFRRSTGEVKQDVGAYRDKLKLRCCDGAHLTLVGEFNSRDIAMYRCSKCMNTVKSPACDEFYRELFTTRESSFDMLIASYAPTTEALMPIVLHEKYDKELGRIHDNLR